jgi:hypothetical protein
MFSKLLSILFADDTTLYDSSINSLDELIKGFAKKFENLFDWIKYNKLYINWSKTKFMLITNIKLNTCFITLPQEKFCLKTKSLFYKPCFIDLVGNKVEVLSEFKLLGITIDEKLTFEPHVKLLRSKNIRFKNFFFYHTKSKFIFFKHLFFHTLIIVHLYLYILLIPY